MRFSWGIGLAALAAAAVAFLAFAGRGARIARGRAGRVARLSRLAARMSASRLGAWVRRRFASPAGRARIDAAQRKADAARIAETMGQMKGALMKLGQMASFVSDAVPEEYRAALQMLQAAAPPMALPALRDVAERELGRPLERAFAAFDERPLAAASIGQVHRARLPSGEEVVVKVQYPGVAEAIRADLSNFALLYRFSTLLYPSLEPGPVIEELRERLGEELDYRHEARSQSRFAELYEGHPFIHVPRIFPSHSTERVLTSELATGRRYAEVLADDEPRRARWGEIIYRFVFGSLLRFGVFNSDPHPGNYLFGDDGRVSFLDFGCVKYFPDAMLANWRQLVRSHLAGDRAAFRARLVALGFFRAETALDDDALYDWFGYFYEPISRDREFTFDRAYAAASIAHVLKPAGRFAPLGKQLNLPRDFVFANRLQWGVYSILGDLGARANFHRIQREFLERDPPCDELGRLDAEHFRKFTEARGLSGCDLAMTPDGLRERRAGAA